MGLIVGSSIPQKIIRVAGIDPYPTPIFFGMPGLLTVLPEGDNVVYLETDEKLFGIDDSKVDLYALEAWLPVESNPRLQEWLYHIDPNKVVMGGPKVTLTPELFLPYASKLVRGKCDELFETIGQEGVIVNGITRYRKLPRYDLFDVNALSARYGIDKERPPKRGYGILTSDGCRNRCDFCVMSALRYRSFYHKPLEYLEREVNLMAKTYGTQPFAFIYDSNFCQADRWRERFEIITASKLAKNYGAYISANALGPGDAEHLAGNGMRDIFIGLEDINKHYHKNERVIEAADKINACGMEIILSCILNPEDLADRRRESETYDRLLRLIERILPVKVELYFLRYMEGSLLAEKARSERGFDIRDYDEYLNEATDNQADLSTLDSYRRINYFLRDDRRTREILNAQRSLRKSIGQLLKTGNAM